MKNKIIYLLLFALVIVVVVQTVIICQLNFRNNKGEDGVLNDSNIVDLRYNDSFNSIPIYDSEGKVATLEYDDCNILFYLSSSCTSCGDVLTFVNKLQEVLGDENINILLVWNDSIPVSLVEQNGIDISQCYCTDEKTLLNTPTPTSYILDKMGNVTYFNSEIKTTIEKLYTQLSIDQNKIEQFKLNANKYLINLYEITDFKQQQIVYFCMAGCPDCAAADEILSKDVNRDKRNINYLYKYDDVEPEHIKDDYSLFRLVYGIQWYPSFLVLQSSDDYRIVGEVPNNTLLNELNAN